MIKFSPLGIELHFNVTIAQHYCQITAYRKPSCNYYTSNTSLWCRDTTSSFWKKMKITKNVTVMFVQVNGIKGRIKNVANAIYLFVLTIKKQLLFV